jgi:hypothetical protein
MTLASQSRKRRRQPDDQLARSGEAIHGWTGNWVSWFQVSYERLRRMNAEGNPLVAEWRRDAITLSGPPLLTLLRNRS